MSSVYDLIVIGSGPAGQRAAIYASKLGKKVALVEMREVVGGASINTGTIPSKTMREAVLHLSGYNYKSIYGMNYRVKEKITMSDLAFRVGHGDLFLHPVVHPVDRLVVVAGEMQHRLAHRLRGDG